MGANVRELLAQAQAAEVRGDRAQAISLLDEAAQIYDSQDNTGRSEKMRRHIARLRAEGEAAALAPPEEPEAQPVSRREPRAMPDRGPTAPNTSVDAWCSFCCRPSREMGPLVGSPTGAFICLECVSTARTLLPGNAPVAVSAEAFVSKRKQKLQQSEGTTKIIALAEQTAVRQQLEARAAKVTLLLGPEGSGKSVLLSELAPVWLLESGGPPPGNRLAIDVTRALQPDEESAVLRWVLAEPGRRLVLATRGALPDPALTLTGEQGDHAIFGTDAVWLAIGRRLSSRFVSAVEAVFALPALGRESLAALGAHWLASRPAVKLSLTALERLGEMAEASGRGAHELKAMLGRVPDGHWPGHSS